MLEIRTLGGLSLRVDGEPLEDMGSRKAEALLVYLAVEGGKQSRHVLTALLWPESDEAHASTSLRVALSVLRRTLGDYLDISRDMVRIRPESAVRLDVSDLAWKLARDEIDGALEIYRGSFLQGFTVRGSAAFEDWMRCEQERVRRSIVGALHASTFEEIGAGDYLRALGLTRRLLELEPLDESAHRQCMLLLALSGQRSGALTHFERWCKVLHEELGVGPAEETRVLYRQISDGEAETILESVTPPHNLPASQTSFVGRRRELAQIGGLIRDPACRLVTVMGPGGSGKTRLALQAASRALHAFGDGVCFVSLESIGSIDYLVPAITDALPFDVDTVTTRLDQRTQLLHHLSDRSLLLVMDGFEGLVDRAGLLSEILDCATECQILVTSRQRLNLRGEWVLTLEGLPLPQDAEDVTLDESDAVRLFMDRARQKKGDGGLSRDEREHVVRICELVEGMPLAIELAAAQTSVLSPREVAEEMEKGLDILSTSTRDIPARHRSLRAAFDSSWQLLTDEQQKAFCKLSVFRGGFDRQAALDVAGVGLRQLSALLDRSLLQRHRVGTLTMHGLLREFAVEKLSQQAALQQHMRDCHSRYYVDLLIQREDDFLGRAMLQARDELRKDAENVRAAVRWASRHWDTQPARRMLIALLSFYVVQGWYEGADVFGDIARVRGETLPADSISDPSTDPIIVSARAHQAFLQTNLGQIDQSERVSRACIGNLADLGFTEELSECLHNMGVNASFRGQYDQAQELLEEAILLGRECGHPMWPTYLLWLGHVYFLLGEYERGLLTLRRCYDIFDQQGTLWGMAFALSKMGLAADGLGDHSQAMAYHREALSVFERMDNRAGKGYCLSRMGMSATFLEDYAGAMRRGQEGYQVFEEIGHRWGLCTSLCGLGFAHIGLGRIEDAKNCFKEALQQAKEDRMLPLSLYALAGLACILVQEGERQSALEVFRYVRDHPQIPTIYLAMAGRWLGDLDSAPTRRPGGVGGVEQSMDAVEELLARALG